MSHIPREPLRFGLYVSKARKAWVFSAFFCVFMAVFISRSTVIIIKNLTDAISQQNLNFDIIWFWAIAFAVAWFFVQLFYRLSGFSARMWMIHMKSTAYKSLYSYLTHHNKDYFNNRFAGALANKMSNASDGVEAIYSQILWKFFPLIFGLLLYMFITWQNDPRLSIVITVWSLFFIGMNMFFAKKLRPLAKHSAEQYSRMKGTIIDSLSNISTVHEYAHVSHEKRYVHSYIKSQVHASLRQWWVGEWILFINGFFMFLFIFTMMSLSVYLFQMGIITVGAIVMIITIVGDIISHLLFIGQEINNAAQRYGQAQEGLDEVLTKHQIVDGPDAKNVKIKKGLIDFDNVTFRYDDTYVFKGFNLKIKHGEKVGIVGRSGAGKSTLVSLLLRHFDVQDGTIRIDKHNLKEITLESLRKAIAFVPQDTSLFHRSIFENIQYSKPGAKKKEVEKAAKMALADEFIKNLPHKYDTLVGERGVKLSGGQRQRVAIARAFLKDAPILVLDEATSALDSESEQAIQTSLDRLMKNRTVIAIAHRLSTLRKMDRILIIEDGEIVEDGSPDMLLHDKNGVFKKLWDHQVSGFILDEE